MYQTSSNGFYRPHQTLTHSPVTFKRHMSIDKFNTDAAKRETEEDDE